MKNNNPPMRGGYQAGKECNPNPTIAGVTAPNEQNHNEVSV